MTFRRILCLVLAVCSLMAPLALAAGPPFLPAGTPFAQETITVSSAAVGVTNTLCRVGGVATGSETPSAWKVG